MNEPAKKMHVLLVEDTPAARKIAETFLKVWGCEVATAEDGTSALELSKHTAFDLIYMDLGLPDIDGIEIVKRIKEDSENSNSKTPIIGLTADASQEKIDTCIQVGFKEILKKPLTQDMHEQILQRYLP